MTNGDKIRAMTDEELAAWLEPTDCGDCPCCEKCKSISEYKRCKDKIAVWLKEEADA